MTDLLLYGDTERSAALRHEIPIAIGDPFLWAERDGHPHVLASVLERSRLEAARPDVTILGYEELGFHELLRSGISRHELELELSARAVQRWGIAAAAVDAQFPLGLADRLRADGVELHVDQPRFAARRRVKTPTELAGIRRAQVAAEAAMAAAAAMLRSASVRRERLIIGDEPLTADLVRAEIRRVCSDAGASAPPDIVVASVLQGFGHEPGHGQLPADLPIQIDLWPRDEDTGCWADMTRTFVVGEVGSRVLEQEALVGAVLQEVRAAIRPGATGLELHELTCERFEAAGYRTQRSGPDERHPEDGMQFSLGHGIGLELHEGPGLGMTGREELVPGDVIAIEPGLWEHDLGGVRFEDLVLVTPDGGETLTDFHYELAP